MPDSIICYGEALWDCLPEGLFFGGAPVNVARHLAQLAKNAVPVTCVGNDFLGEEARERMERSGLPLDLVHEHDSLRTGAVKVKLDSRGNADYEILEPVAWDRIPVDERVTARAETADAVVYGTLAQRGDFNRGQIRALLALERPFKVYDVNLRPPYDDLELVAELARSADLLKLNEEELYRLLPRDRQSTPLEPATRRLSDTTGVPRICVTRAEKGAVYLAEGEWFAAEGRQVGVRDTVGAGDGFLAVFLANSLGGNHPPQRVLENACRFGEFIATRDGAVPAYDPDEWLLA